MILKQNMVTKSSKNLDEISISYIESEDEISQHPNGKPPPTVLFLPAEDGNEQGDEEDLKSMKPSFGLGHITNMRTKMRQMPASCFPLV